MAGAGATLLGHERNPGVEVTHGETTQEESGFLRTSGSQAGILALNYLHPNYIYAERERKKLLSFIKLLLFWVSSIYSQI